MSLSRLAIRLAAVEMLCPTPLIETGPYPTWAGKNVYDSRITSIADADAWKKFLEEVEGEPILSVYTEEQETEPQNGEYPADKEMADLVAELMIAARGEVTVEGPDGKPMTVGSLEAAITSPQIESMLDMLEQQVRNLLDPDVEQPQDTTVAAARTVYLKLARELHHVKSAPMRDATNRLSRVAARTLTFRLRIPHVWGYGKKQAGVPDDIAGLPEPLLTVAKSLTPTSAAGQLVRQIAKGQMPAATLSPLNDIRIFSNVDRGAAPTLTTTDLKSDVKL